MRRVIERMGGRALFAFDPETAHGLSIRALKSGLVRPACPAADPRLAVIVAGMEFPNPLGMAAGYDKNAEVPDALLRLGFGFVEVGTVTPLPQPGNSKPRIFRLEQDHAVINRLGFNNGGHAAAEVRLGERAGRPGIVGVNIGANKDATDRIGDYVAGIERFHALASYFTVNVSSPNTPGLRDLQARASLAELLGRVLSARDRLAAEGGRRSVFLKIAPDLDERAMDDIAAECGLHDLDGLVVSNTTLSRVGLSKDPGEAGGLSGAPLFERSTIVLARMRQRLGPKLALIGVGGVDSAEHAITKIAAGADLVQLYTGLIYGGPSLPSQVIAGMSAHLDRGGMPSIASLRDSAVREWAERDLPG